MRAESLRCLGMALQQWGRLLAVGVLGVLLGMGWLLGGSGLWGPFLSMGLVVVVAAGREATERFLAAWGYYATGCWPIIGAATGYWGPGHLEAGVAAWAACSAALAGPWIGASGPVGLLLALAATALPPLGVIGWLSPLNASGVLFPGLGWMGLGSLVLLAIAMQALVRRLTGGDGDEDRDKCGDGKRRWFPARAAVLGLTVVAMVANGDAYRDERVGTAVKLPKGWVGVRTHVVPSRNSVLGTIENNQILIEAARAQGRGARVVVLPEALLGDWLPGTRQEFAAAVPPGQIWLIGAQAGKADAVVLVSHGRAAVRLATRAAGLLLGGDWQPWVQDSLQPAWWQRVFVIGGKRVWAALCVEQVQPWTWLEALWQRPDVILAMSNDWWAPEGNAAPEIQAASALAWARLMGVPLVGAVNRSWS
ncbi:TraB family protein [Thiomonas sp. X19]|uniref:conjugal transfer protein TraB n=1 Tax=Thiomonas sp. X19 TaxID=1050370 RepID=UPI000B70B141|nr:conjugal transfer protein TraB [Thiomonas sp. X19]SCC93133.1 TraB family protein [Thiomonas sp. X19]